MTWNSSAIVFDLDDTLYKESHYFKHIFSYFCEINEWPKSSYVNIINNFSDIRMQHKDIFGYYLKQNRDYWKINNEYEDIKYFGYLRNLLFSLYINIDINLSPIRGAIDWLDYAAYNSIKVGVLTNGIIKAQYNKWRNLNIPYKDNITFVSARECIKEKPSYEPFKYISDSMGVELNEVTFIGDRFENDIECPLSMGSTGILINKTKIGENSMFHSATDLYSALLFFQKINMQ
jgi:HAD superfamily hydrolase (TIGR01549 family)